MASTNFVDHSASTPIVAAWLNDIDRLNYDIFQNAQTVSEAVTALGLTPPGSDPTFNTVTISTLTSGRVPIVSTAGLLIDDSGLTFNTGTNALTTTTFIGALTGNASSATLASTITVVDAGGDTTTFPVLVGSATGSLAALTDPGLSYQATTNILTAGGFAGPINGTVGATTPAAGAFTTVSATGQITSTVSTGTAPLVIASTTAVTNLNASLLLGGTWAIPGSIGATTPAAGAFTTLTTTGNVTLGNAASDTLTVNAETISQPNIPCFLAYNSASDANATGAGATVTVDFDTEVIDQSGDFSADTFTAPATGVYLLSAQVRASSIPAGSTSIVMAIVTSNRTYSQTWVLTAGTFTTFPCNLTVAADMDAADTARVDYTISGGAGDTASVNGGVTLLTWFSGVRIA